MAANGEFYIVADAFKRHVIDPYLPWAFQKYAERNMGGILRCVKHNPI